MLYKVSRYVLDGIDVISAMAIGKWIISPTIVRWVGMSNHNNLYIVTLFNCWFYIFDQKFNLHEYNKSQQIESGSC